VDTGQMTGFLKDAATGRPLPEEGASVKRIVSGSGLRCLALDWSTAEKFRYSFTVLADARCIRFLLIVAGMQLGVPSSVHFSTSCARQKRLRTRSVLG